MGLSGVCVFVLASISGGYAHHPTLTECHLQMIKGDGVDLNKYYTLGQGQVKKLKLLRLTGEWSGTGQGLSTSCVIVLDDCQFNCICQGRTSAILVQAFNWEKWCVLLPNYITQSQRRSISKKSGSRSSTSSVYYGLGGLAQRALPSNLQETLDRLKVQEHLAVTKRTPTTPTNITSSTLSITTTTATASTTPTPAVELQSIDEVDLPYGRNMEDKTVTRETMPDVILSTSTVTEAEAAERLTDEKADLSTVEKSKFYVILGFFVIFLIVSIIICVFLYFKLRKREEGSRGFRGMLGNLSPGPHNKDTEPLTPRVERSSFQFNGPARS